MASDKNPKSNPHATSGPRVIIIGGGIAGVITALSLSKNLKFRNFIIYEQSNDIGGTWNLNTYPGCASDVATHWYSLSTELNPNWDQTHVFQPQLKSYWKDISTKHDLNKHFVFFTRVISAEWNTAKQGYDIEVEDVRTGKRKKDWANAVVSAIGVLNVPHRPEELKGIRDGTFKGQHFHSARWNHDVSLQGKRVAVIGNGCSAAQFVPIIAEDPTTQIVNFCRTPNWTLPVWRKPYSKFQMALFKYVPLMMKLHRWLLFCQHEMYWILLFRGGPKNFIRERVMGQLRDLIKQDAPPELVEQLTPKYPLGCKRFVVDSGYYKALNLPNNDITFDGIARITEKGIVTKSGKEYEFDVIIEATGFVVDDYPIKVKGVDGKTIQKYNREQGGPTAYKSTTVPGFPNFFLISGPNSATGHASVIFTEEVQVNYITQLLHPILDPSHSQITSLEVTQAATDTWNSRIQSRLRTSVWSVCQSWYQVGRGTGKNSAIWPGPVTEQWWELKKPVWSDYNVVGSDGDRAKGMRRVEEWEREKRRGTVAWEMIGTTVLAVVLALVWKSWGNKL